MALSLRQGRLAPPLLVLCVFLTGCFDLAQRVTIDRGGAGHYAVAVSASGLVGEALKDKPVHIDAHDGAKVVTRITDKDGRVTQTSTIAFKQLSDLKLSDEAISLHVLGHSVFGLGPTHVRFRRTFLVNHARRENAKRMGNDVNMGSQIMASVFGDHTYVFSVTVPGSILRIAPVKLGGIAVVPAVTGDFYHGHTVTWTMPLYHVLREKMLTFEVDFSAYGSFKDAQSIPKDATAL